MVEFDKKCLQKSPEVVAKKVADQVILVPVRQNAADLQCIYTLDSTGAFIWSLLESPRAFSDIVQAVTERYQVETCQAERDLAEFLTQMVSIKAISAS